MGSEFAIGALLAWVLTNLYHRVKREDERNGLG